MSEQEMLRWQQVSMIKNLQHESYQKEEMCTMFLGRFWVKPIVILVTMFYFGMFWVKPIVKITIGLT
jgi:hypothetical protein